ncbi:isoaspartyl peptidase/L-asparaginase [Eubacteriales bacterium OttesenSCG-928-M02]|nr:isoaspartyl peptidase/L-asparaginase [Eubacteriales bacterium OttesenSCG-928-M02]
MKPILLATWPFAERAVHIGGRLLEEGGNAMDAAVQTVAAIEDDPLVDSVGFGAIPNIYGQVELDAACMDGETLSLDAVMGLNGFRNPVRVAQDLVQEQMNNVLCGEGAAEYAQAKGHKRGVLITDAMRQKWETDMGMGKKQPVGHDTVCCLSLDEKGHLASVISTSGLGYKHRGRVGDSPLVGSGFYADDEVGAAAATGVGEDIMKGCISFLIVERMRAGDSPQQASEWAIARHCARLRRGGMVPRNISVIALDKHGNYGGAGTEAGYSYSIYTDGETKTIVSTPMPL